MILFLQYAYINMEGWVGARIFREMSESEISYTLYRHICMSIVEPHIQKALLFLNCCLLFGVLCWHFPFEYIHLMMTNAERLVNKWNRFSLFSSSDKAVECNICSIHCCHGNVKPTDCHFYMHNVQCLSSYESSGLSS